MLSVWKTLPDKQRLLLMMTVAMTVAFYVWSALLNNFTVEVVGFTGREIGMLHSLRELPGFLAFTVVLVVLLVREQRLAVVSLLLLGVATALTGFFPTIWGLYCLTVLSSIGFHYYETVNQSLSLQWLETEKTSEFFGRQLAVASGASIVAYLSVIVGMSWFDFSYTVMFALAGVFCCGLAVWVWWQYPRFEGGATQHKHLFLRRSYWLYYLLVFLAGARRQIFTVFAGFLMVEKFGYSVSAVAGLYLVNCVINLVAAPTIGRWIAKVGERKALLIEYAGLVVVFLLYAVVESGAWAAVLYVVDHLLFAMAIALKSYLKRIADPKDMAGTASVSFTINHIAAVFLPALLGVVWLWSPSAVFVIGAALAFCSFLASLLVPEKPAPGYETRFALSG